MMAVLQPGRKKYLSAGLRILFVLWVLDLGLLGRPLDSGGQEVVHMRIVDEAGKPLPGASVLVFRRAEQSLSEVPLSSDGSTTLVRVSLINSFIKISHIGYQTRILDRPDLSDLEVVVLERLPMLMEGIGVSVDGRRSCRAGEASAEEELANVATLYDAGPTEKLSAVFEYSEVVSDLSAVGTMIRSVRRERQSSAWFSAHLRDWSASKVAARVVEQGWVWRGVTGEPVIPDFGGRHAAIFISEGFRTRHRVWLEERDEGTSVLGFCGRAPERTELRGKLQIGEDGFAEHATWEVWRRGQVLAWGNIDFLKPTPGGRPLHQMLPMRSRTWLRVGQRDLVSGEELIRFRDVEYQQWTVDGVAIPFGGEERRE
jgi:hypothetical protein